MSGSASDRVAVVTTSARSLPVLKRSSNSAAEQDGALGNVAPAFDQPEELLVAGVDFPGKLIAGSHFADDILADFAVGLQYGVVELEDFHGAFVLQPLQRQRVVRVEFGQRAREFGCGDRLDETLIAGIEAFPHALIDADGNGAARLLHPGVIVIRHRRVEAERRVKPRPDPFGAVNRAGPERLHDLAARQDQHRGAEAPENLAAGPRHPVAQPLETLRRGNLAGIPSAHLATGVGAKQRLDVELPSERVPQLLTAAVLDPGEQFVCGEAEGNRCEEMKRGRLLFEIAFVRMVHVGDSGTDRVEGFERAYERSGEKNLYLDAPAGRPRPSARNALRWDKSRAGLRASRSPS